MSAATMTAAAFLESLTARGVQLLPDPSAPSGLRYRAPRGLVTPAVAQRIRAAAPHLLALLEARTRPPGGHLTRPIAQSALPGAPARFASTTTPRRQREAAGYPGPEAGQEALHRWVLWEWERLRGAALPPEVVAGALAAYQADPGAPPAWLRACAPPPGWGVEAEAAHRAAWRAGAS